MTRLLKFYNTEKFDFFVKILPKKMSTKVQLRVVYQIFKKSLVFIT